MSTKISINEFYFNVSVQFQITGVVSGAIQLISYIILKNKGRGSLACIKVFIEVSFRNRIE